jgi:hypothetical protein
MATNMLGRRTVGTDLEQKPGPPHSMLWGHLKAMGEQVSGLPKRVHPHSTIRLDHGTHEIGQWLTAISQHFPCGS